MRWDVSDLDRVSGVGSKLREGGARLIKIFVKAKKMSLVMVIYKFAKQGRGLNHPHPSGSDAYEIHTMECVFFLHSV